MTVWLLHCSPTLAKSTATLPERQATETVRAARKVMMNDPAAALALARNLEMRVASFPVEAGRQIAMAKAKWIAGEAMLRLNRIDEARNLIDSSYSLALSSGDAQSQGDALLTRGSIKMERGDPAGALKDFLAAHQLFLRTGDARSRSVTLQDLSALYMDAQDYERAELYLRRAEESYRGEPMLQLAMTFNLGSLLLAQKRYDEAEVELRRSASIARRAGSSVLEVSVLSRLAFGQIEQDRLRAATRTIADALSISRQKGSTIDDDLRLALARLAFAKGDIGGARQNISTLFDRANSKQTMSYKDMHHSAYQIYKAAGDAGRALAHLEIAARLREEATEISISNKSSLMAARFDFASQKLRIATLKADKLQDDVTNEQAAAARQRLLTLAVGVAILAIIVLLTGGLLVLRRSRNRGCAANAMLEEANIALEVALQEVGHRAQAEQHATQLAEHDALTGLPSRRYLNGSFTDELQRWDKPQSETFLLLLDLDRFKPINDLYGHEIGDLVLCETANRLTSLCAQIGAKAVRLGGDEFVVVMNAPAGDAAPRQIANQIIHDVSAPIDISGRRLTVGASIGIARYPLNGASMEELLRAADIAMYEAKRSGRKTFSFFNAAMAEHLRNRADTEADLRSALRDGQIMAYFQPIHCFQTGGITGFEALARWKHPLRGMVPPDEFITIAEEVGLIEEVTTTVLHQACQAARDWPNNISISVNLSPLLLRDPWISIKIFSILSQARLLPERLIIEVTETAVIDDLALAADVLHAFRQAGVRIAMDDFGKGYSSLSHLRELDFDHLKLDSSFVLTLDQDDSMKITTAVAALGQALSMPVTAEGVETAEVAAKLKELGFRYAQGYLYGKAVPREQAHLLVLQTMSPDHSDEGHLTRANNG